MPRGMRTPAGTFGPKGEISSTTVREPEREDSVTVVSMLNGRMELPIGPLRGGWAKALRVMRRERERFRPARPARDDGARARGDLAYTAADDFVQTRFLLNGEDGGDGQEDKERRRRMSRKKSGIGECVNREENTPPLCIGRLGGVEIT